MKSLKTLMPLMIVVISIAIVGIGMVSAQTKSNSDSKNDKFSAKVAEILGLDVKEVDAAFQQAREDIRNEMISNIEEKLSIAVENGKMTKEEARRKIDYITGKGSVSYIKKFHYHKSRMEYKNKEDRGNWLNKRNWKDKPKVTK